MKAEFPPLFGDLMRMVDGPDDLVGTVLTLTVKDGNNMKDQFVGFVSSMVAGVSEHHIRAMAEEVPAPFWTAPASSTGKHHPRFSLHEGGLVRHSMAVLFIARDLCRPWGIDSEVGLSVVSLAAAFHDSFKGGTGDEWTETVGDHPALAAQMLSRYADEEMDAMGRAVVMLAAKAVAQHMSMWSEPQVLPIDSIDGDFAQVVATADYVASRKYLSPMYDYAAVMRDFGWPDVTMRRG